MRKKIIILAVFLSLSKLYAQVDIQIIAPVISGSLVGSEINDFASGAAIKATKIFDDNNIGVYGSLAYAVSNPLSDYGIKVAVGPVFKIKEKEDLYMTIGAAPQIVLFQNGINLSFEIDYQTKFIPDKKYSPALGINSNINYFTTRGSSQSDSFLFGKNKSVSTETENISTFYFTVVFQIYLAFCFNLN